MTHPPSNLALAPWIPVRDLDGQHSLAPASTALDQAHRLVLDTTGPLEAAALLRFLTAVIYAAGLAPASAQQYAQRCARAEESDWSQAARWLEAHHDHFDLLHPERPLFQDVSLHQVRPAAALPVRYLDHTTAGSLGRPLLHDHRHLYADLPPLPPAEAALLLITQQTWAIGGRLRCSDADYGKGSNYASAAAACGKLLWLPHGTLASTLTWRTVPHPQVGNANWTYRPRSAPREKISPADELDALTWMYRRTLFLTNDDGHIHRAHFAQGWNRTGPTPGMPGTNDLLFTRNGKQLPCTAATTPDDLPTLVERWWHAESTSLPGQIRAAAHAAGRRPPPMRVIGIATDQKKALHLRDITVPSDLLTDPAAASASALLTTLRHQMNPLSAALPDLTGTALLTDPAFRAADPATRARTLAHTLHHRTPTARTAATDRAEARKLLTRYARKEDPSVASLFVTADTTAPSEHTAGQMLAKRLHGIRASAHGRGLLQQMEQWTKSLTHNKASEPVTRDLPEHYRTPAMLTAALFAVHTHLHGPRFGNTPLPRLMRAFGNASGRGPHHQPTETQMQHLLATTRTTLMLPSLANLVRYAAAHDMTPSWAALADDLAHWNRDTRHLWAAQFYTSQPLTELRMNGTPSR